MLVKSLNSAVCIFVSPGQISAEDAQCKCCYLGEQRVRFALGPLLLLILVDGEKKNNQWYMRTTRESDLNADVLVFCARNGEPTPVKRQNNTRRTLKRVKMGNQTPVLLCSASSFATLISASRTSALSSQVYHSSSSWRKLEVPVVSDTFRVASLHSRSMKPGIFRSVAKKRKTI